MPCLHSTQLHSLHPILLFGDGLVWLELFPVTDSLFLTIRVDCMLLHWSRKALETLETLLLTPFFRLSLLQLFQKLWVSSLWKSHCVDISTTCLALGCILGMSVELLTA